MIDLTLHPSIREKNIRKAREHKVILPTFAQMKDPSLIPLPIQNRLTQVGLWDVDPLNLFRITWKNQPQDSGGGFGKVNYLELPKELTGVSARIIGLVGKWFPTGCHKVGASIGCLMPPLVTGQFDAYEQKAVWPSTGNYCRGGAFNSKLLSCNSIAILPEGMSRERFDWLSQIAGEVIATPGCESNVKEIFDKTWELRSTRKDIMIFNQFEEMGNHLWHYEVTGQSLLEAFEDCASSKSRLSGAFFTSGSAGTMGAGDFLKTRHPQMKLAVGEALQCPTLLNNGFGDHRIEGIGDKHVPWIHNVKNTDMAVAIDDDNSHNLMRLFNEPEGIRYLIEVLKLDPQLVSQLAYLGISGIANVLGAIKMAKYYEWTEEDVIVTVFTDSMDMYGSRLEELKACKGPYTLHQAAADHGRHLLALSTDHLEELTYLGKKRIHNLKYYTWVEQQGKSVEALNALWYDPAQTWEQVHHQASAIDALIEAFNEETGLLEAL